MQLKGILKVQENKKTNCRVQCNHKEPVKYFIKIMTVMRTNLKTQAQKIVFQRGQMLDETVKQSMAPGIVKNKTTISWQSVKPNHSGIISQRQTS